MKTKLLIVGITMNCAGTEKSFLSFLSCLDFERFDVTLLLAKREGLLLDQLPKQVKVVIMEKYGDLFLLSGRNAARTLFNCFVKENPLTLFEIFPYFIGSALTRGAKRASIAYRMWVHFMQKMPEIKDEYDVAVAYWGDRTMFYMCDKVKAKKKIAWLHFDYSNPPRDDELYGEYFNRCDKVVTVSKLVDESLKNKLPNTASRCVMMENITNPRQIWDLALRGETFPDLHFHGKRILTIGRIGDQKGLDMVIPVLKRLRKENYNVRWYVLGDGEEEYKQQLSMALVDAGVADMMLFLGTTTNPYTYMRDCDIYAQPSRHEGKPIAVEEAKIMYKPILATKYLSAPEQLDNGRLGVLCDISSDGIYNGIKKLLDNPVMCDHFTETLSHCKFGNSSEIEKFYDMIGE
ncbi:MAG: glycosyltransferase [Clostridiales bacterium]|nr:glycosyltransferase [Clostridiales bacterium]